MYAIYTYSIIHCSFKFYIPDSLANNLLEQFIPSPMNPSMQLQSNPPILLEQFAYLWQLCDLSSHSLLSTMYKHKIHKTKSNSAMIKV